MPPQNQPCRELVDLVLGEARRARRVAAELLHLQGDAISWASVIKPIVDSTSATIASTSVKPRSLRLMSAEGVLLKVIWPVALTVRYRADDPWVTPIVQRYCGTDRREDAPAGHLQTPWPSPGRKRHPLPFRRCPNRRSGSQCNGPAASSTTGSPVMTKCAHVAGRRAIEAKLICRVLRNRLETSLANQRAHALGTRPQIVLDASEDRNTGIAMALATPMKPTTTRSSKSV